MLRNGYTHISGDSERRKMRTHERSYINKKGRNSENHRHDSVMYKTRRRGKVRDNVKHFFYYLPDINKRKKGYKRAYRRKQPRSVSKISVLTGIPRKS